MYEIDKIFEIDELRVRMYTILAETLGRGRKFSGEPDLYAGSGRAWPSVSMSCTSATKVVRIGDARTGSELGEPLFPESSSDSIPRSVQYL